MIYVHADTRILKKGVYRLKPRWQMAAFIRETGMAITAAELALGCGSAA